MWYTLHSTHTMELDDYELVQPGDSGDDSESDDPQVDVRTYQRWAAISNRSYPDVTINEYGAVDDEGAEQYYAENPSHFARDVMIYVKATGAHTVNFKVTAIDDETGTQAEVLLRIDTDDDTFEHLHKYIEDSVAPPYMSSNTVGSDTVTDRRIVWKLDWFQLITQLDTPGVSMIVGSADMFLGYTTKVIDKSDHNIVYSSADCLFICLNEFTGKRYLPSMLRQHLLNMKEESNLPISTRKDLVKLAEHYGCRVAVHSLDDGSKSITSKDASLPTLRLVKMGSAIGIIESVSQEIIGEMSPGVVLHAHYDFETVSKSDSTQVYSFAMIYPDNRRLCLLHHDRRVLARSIRLHLKEFLMSLPTDVSTVHLHAWNGSRFDHPILMRMCNEKFKISATVMNDQREVLTASLHYNSKTLVLRDPCKMFPMTLNEAATTFGLDMSKLPMDHDAVEAAYMAGTLERYLADNYDVIRSYVMRDVELLRKVTQHIMTMYEESGINYNRWYTRSMASLSSWKDSLSTDVKTALASLQFGYSDQILFTSTTTTMEDIRKECIAGRVQGVKGEHRHVTLVDFRSMYSCVATNEMYPCGDYVGTVEYVPDKLGLYLVRVISQGHPSVIPYRPKPLDNYDWSYKGEFTKLLTSVDVECLVEAGYEFEVADGIYWRDSADYFSGHMVDMFAKRKTYKDKGDPVMGEHYKSMANSLTGALFQQLRREYTKVFATKHEADVYMKMYRRYVKMTQELIYDDGQIVLFFYPKKLTDPQEIKVQREVCKGAVGSKPIILTMFIYAYARAKLWRMWRHVEDNDWGTVVYCDTDSLAVAAGRTAEGKVINISSKLREYIGTQMGDLDVVMRDASMVVVSPKVYAMRDKAGVERVRAKGMRRKGTFYLVEPGGAKLIREMRNMTWVDMRRAYHNHDGIETVDLSYDTLVKVLGGYSLMSVYWYFTRDKGVVHKRYSMRVIKVKHV